MQKTLDQQMKKDRNIRADKYIKAYTKQKKMTQPKKNNNAKVFVFTFIATFVGCYIIVACVMNDVNYNNWVNQLELKNALIADLLVSTFFASYVTAINNISNE